MAQHQWTLNEKKMWRLLTSAPPNQQHMCKIIEPPWPYHFPNIVFCCSVFKWGRTIQLAHTVSTLESNRSHFILFNFFFFFFRSIRNSTSWVDFCTKNWKLALFFGCKQEIIRWPIRFRRKSFSCQSKLMWRSSVRCVLKDFAVFCVHWGKWQRSLLIAFVKINADGCRWRQCRMPCSVSLGKARC